MFGSTQTECVVRTILGPEFYGELGDDRVNNLSLCQDITLSNFCSVGGEEKFPGRDHERKRRFFQKG